MNRSPKATMQTVKTVQLPHRNASGSGLCVAALAFVGLATFATRLGAAGGASPSELTSSSRIEGIATYERYARALELLERGDDGRAKAILNAARRDPLTVNAGGIGAGVMQSVGPSVLLIRVARLLGQKAEQASRAGRADEAREWLHCGYRLADQIAGTPRPNVDALTLAHSIDVRIATVEARSAAQTGDGAAWAVAEERCQTLIRAWRDDLLPALPKRAMTPAEITATDEARLENLRSRYCRWRRQAGIVTG